MASSDTFDDFRKELNEQWKHHTSNFLLVFTTVTENALAKLLEKLPKKFDKKSEDYTQKSIYKKKSRCDKNKHRDQITKHLHWESSDNAKAQAIQDHLVEKWNLKIDWVC